MSPEALSPDRCPIDENSHEHRHLEDEEEEEEIIEMSEEDVLRELERQEPAILVIATSALLALVMPSASKGLCHRLLTSLAASCISSEFLEIAMIFAFLQVCSRIFKGMQEPVSLHKLSSANLADFRNNRSHAVILGKGGVHRCM